MVELDNFLKQNLSSKGEIFTNTRIPCNKNNIYGGKYNIADDKYENFINIYYNHVFIKKNNEYLTEKQLIEHGPLLIDIDFRYNLDITSKQHLKDHLIDLVMLYADNISKYFNIENNKSINVYILEKKHVNIQDKLTKDGIHIIFGIKVHKALQVIFRENILKEITNIWEDLPITNSWEDVFDEGVTKGFVNWQLYGSKKPDNEPYLLKYNFRLKYSNNDWEIEDKNIMEFNLKNNIHKLSARYPNHPSFSLNDNAIEEFESKCKELKNKNTKKNVILKKSTNNIKYNEINDSETLDNMIEEMLENLNPTNYKIKETHLFTMTLTEKYYGPGSYNNWIRLGWALKNTSNLLFLSWLKISSNDNCRNTLKGDDGKFDWNNVEELYNIWQGFEECEGLTERSIMYWSKIDSPNEYDIIRKNTIDYYIDHTIDHCTEFDIATVLYNIYKDKYVCISIKNNIWYEFKNQRWYEIDSGSTLRLCISKGVFLEYFNRIVNYTNITISMENTDEGYEPLRKKINKLTEITLILKKTQWKNNIMREARELFYDNEFLEKIDSNPYLLCFKNCVIDFKNNICRKGLPYDYLTKCTNIDYVKLDAIKHKETINEINNFMKELFPCDYLRKYMWEHLASVLIGTNDNQTFNIYTGSGRNGKSCLVDLMKKCLGQYKGTVPITLITQKRNNIGSTSSEIVQLIGTRYAVMQEPSKGDKINEGIMKEITGGDPIQGRALFKDTITFIPQFKLVVCTNTLFDIKSNDDGTWRRIRVCDFKSKFLENPYENNLFPESEFPHQFKLNKKLAEEKFNIWAPIFMSMLVQISFIKKGLVEDCDVVLSSSNQYREGQDYISEFCKEKILYEEGETIKKTELWSEFKEWYVLNYGRYIPKGSEVYNFMNRKYGDYNRNKGGWINVKIIYDYDESEGKF